MGILDELTRWAAASPETPALLSPGRDPVSRAELVAATRTIAKYLADAGVKHGDVVAMVLPDGVDLVLAFAGITSVAACAPLNPASSRAEFEFSLGELRPRALVVDSRDSAAAAVAAVMGLRVIEFPELPAVDARVPALDSPGSSDVAVVIFTSATTDRAKGVPLTHGNLAAMLASTQRALALSENDRFLSMMPLFHLQGLISTLSQLLAGGSIVFLGGLEAGRLGACIREYLPTWYTAGPALHGAILSAGSVEAGRLRFVRSIGARMAPQLMADVEKALGVPVLEGYGLTETGLVTSNACPPGQRKPGSVGRSCGPEVAILGSDGTWLGPQQEGEIAVRGPSVMRGYREDEAATRRAFQDGWFLTGDLGHLDEEGFLYVTGRIKEMINRGGEKVLPAEVEDVLLAHPSVKKAAAFGRPHPTLGEDVAAAVVLHKGARANEWELRSHAAGHLTAFKVPRRIFFVEAIPVGATGKVRRADLARDLSTRIAHHQAPRSSLERSIAGIWRKVLNVERVGVHDDFFDLGGDSFAVTLMMAELEAEFGPAATALDTSTFFETPEIATLASLLEGETAAPFRKQNVLRQPLLALQRHGGRTPFYCVPGADENPYYFRELAQEHGEEQPFYIVRDPRPMEDRSAYTVEEMAARFVDQIRAVQVDGPYLLGGHCFGGIVAYEMARQLVAQGHRVDRLVLFETPAPGYPKVLRHWKGYGRQAMAVLKGERQVGFQELQSHARVLLGLCRKRAFSMGRRVAVLAPLAHSSARDEHPNWKAGREYRLKPLHCDVLQLVSAEEEHSTTVLDDPLTAWREFVRGKFEVAATSGKADRIFRQPHVRVLARRMRAALDGVLVHP
ncbi:AMP-binding protein [Paludibaculum fermentans]|uniref:AMP-binding protein n=1 Tax=Paludibaculum fermentans TaxID=1473598 RepID=A0A7S7NW52_PALFE|nr:AMP-binding protein [Paludibaculum fermentans]QOY90918.1 AMP-binding protein [Paludibaculum fermentans]